MIVLQISFAYFLAIVYSVVQLLVLIGIIVPMFMVSPIYCNVNALFFFFTAGTFLLCGLLHPRELVTLAQGFVYYIAIPTMYMILMLYAICNLHVISWGTREAKPKADQKKPESMAAGPASRGLLGGLITRTMTFFGISRSCVSDMKCCGSCECCRPMELRVVIDPQVSGKATEMTSSATHTTHAVNVGGIYIDRMSTFVILIRKKCQQIIHRGYTMSTVLYRPLAV